MRGDLLLRTYNNIAEFMLASAADRTCWPALRASQEAYSDWPLESRWVAVLVACVLACPYCGPQRSKSGATHARVCMHAHWCTHATNDLCLRQHDVKPALSSRKAPELRSANQQIKRVDHAVLSKYDGVC